MTRVLVLGGGGYIGAAVVAAAQTRGWDVALSTRSDRQRANISGNPERFVGDDANPADIENWAQSRDLIIDAAAPYALTLTEKGLSRAQRISAAKARMDGVLAAARRSGAALVHVGSFVTVTTPGSVTDRAARAAHPYFAMKYEMAAACLAAARMGQPVGLAAPTALFGPGDLRPDDQSFVGAVLTGLLQAAPTRIINVLDVRDAAEGALAAFEKGWLGVPIPLSGHDIAASDLGRLIAELGGVRAPVAMPGLAVGAAAMVAAEYAAAAAGLRAQASLPALLTLVATSAAISPAQRAIGVAPRPLATTIADEIAWRRR